LIANDGQINYCVRWESDVSVSAQDRANIATAVEKQLGLWMNWLYGFEGFPYTSVPVKVVGWAVRDANLLQGDTSNIKVYIDTDADGIPQCAESCGRFFHQDNNYSGCAAGADNHYGQFIQISLRFRTHILMHVLTDMSLWLTEGFEGGAGGDWGQRISREYFMDLVNSGEESIHILLHEMGHTFALDGAIVCAPSKNVLS